MKLEVGKTYKTRGGEKVKIVYDDSTENCPFLGIYIGSDLTQWYSTSGTSAVGRPYDILSEDIPTRTYYRAAVYKVSYGDEAYYKSSVYWFESKEAFVAQYTASEVDVFEWETRELADLGE